MRARSHDARETAALIDWRALVDGLKRAALEVDDGRIVCPERIVMPMADGAVLMSMPARADDIAIHKLITVAPANAARGLPTILGTVTAFDPSTGEARCVLDGPTVTGRRTAAVSMLAIEVFAPIDVERILLIGTGSQARHHVGAIAALHPRAEVRVRGRSREAALRFCDGCDARPAALAPVADDDEEADEADGASVVITCTTSRVPVYRAPARRDRLVIAVGSFEPSAAEIAPATVRGSALVVDDPHGAPHEAGDLLQAGVDWRRVTSLATALREPGSRPSDPVLFKSVGCAAWDLAAMRVALRAIA